jgi:peroxiredoxin
MERKDEVEQIGAQVLLVTFAEPSLLEKKMMHDLQNPFPPLIDPSKETYRRWGMGKTNAFGAVLSPELNVRYLNLLIKGERFLGLAPDMLQLGGDFVVDRRGRISFAHVMTNNGDRADVSRLVDQLRTAAATT